MTDHKPQEGKCCVTSSDSVTGFTSVAIQGSQCKNLEIIFMKKKSCFYSTKMLYVAGSFRFLSLCLLCAGRVIWGSSILVFGYHHGDCIRRRRPDGVHMNIYYTLFKFASHLSLSHQPPHPPPPPYTNNP